MNNHPLVGIHFTHGWPVRQSLRSRMTSQYTAVARPMSSPCQNHWALGSLGLIASVYGQPSIPEWWYQIRASLSISWNPFLNPTTIHILKKMIQKATKIKQLPRLHPPKPSQPYRPCGPSFTRPTHAGGRCSRTQIRRQQLHPSAGDGSNGGHDGHPMQPATIGGYMAVGQNLTSSNWVNEAIQLGRLFWQHFWDVNNWGTGFWPTAIYSVEPISNGDGVYPARCHWHHPVDWGWETSATYLAGEIGDGLLGIPWVWPMSCNSGWWWLIEDLY